MEQHPVPQNVTTFQFRLIGDMTLKQFGYLCAGAILAFISYKLPLPFIITWPLTLVFIFLGVGFAFIPVEERPMDVWVFSFFKSIYSPTQYLWTREQHPEPGLAKNPAPPSPTPATPPTGGAPTPPVLQGTPAVPQAPPASKIVLSGLFQQATVPQGRIVSQNTRPSFFSELTSLFHPKPKATPAMQQTPLPSFAPPIPVVTGNRPPASPQPAPVKPQEDEALHQKMMLLEKNLAKLQEQLATKTATEDRVLELQKQLTEVLTQKSKTEDELINLKRDLAPPTPAQPKPADTPPQTGGRVNVITTQEGAVRAGLPRLTHVPNVVTGIVKDDAGNLLPGILVTVTNREGVPVRALKTNKLGQFGASTPLSPDTYFVEIEDPRSRFTFSRVQITLNGSVVPVLEIIAKSQKALTRERLAQEIFGGQKMQ